LLDAELSKRRPIRRYPPDFSLRAADRGAAPGEKISI
jgi:hypothetical protein